VTPTAHVIHADCRDLVWNEYPHVYVCDLPYSRHVHENATSCGTKGLGGSGPGVHARDFGFEHLTPDLRRHVTRMTTKVKRWSVLYSDFESAWVVRIACEAAGAEYVRPVPWLRWSQPQLSGDRPCTGFEITQLFHRQYVGPRGGRRPIRKSWNGRGNLTEWPHECNAPDALDAWRHKSLRGDDKHKAEKPLDQMLDVCCYFSDLGETVLDETAGYCTTAVACALLGRHSISVERNKESAAAGRARVDAAAAGDLSDRDRERVERWLESTLEAADAKPPRTEAERPAWERAQRRLADAMRVAQKVGA
jgi:DNA methylase